MIFTWSFVIVAAYYMLLASADIVKLQTFNTGLMPRIPEYKHRKNSLVPALLAKGSDVICLQEVWFGNDVEDISAAVKHIYPYSFSAINLEQKESKGIGSHSPPCAYAAKKFLWCLSYRCSHLIGMNALQCAVGCGMMDQPQDCISCILAAGPTKTKSLCVSGHTVHVNPPGLLLLSKRALRHSRLVQYHPSFKQLTQRAYIQTEVDGVGSVTCTHMTARVGKVYLEPILSKKFGSWREQSMDEANQLVSLTERKDRVAIMGDLNCGSEIPKQNIDGDLQESYKRLMSQNLKDPYVTKVGRCTFCADNALNDDNDNRNWILDHILVRGYKILDAAILYQSNLTGMSFPLSDHYSIQVKLET